MYKINLNCDLGEGAKYDNEIIPLISSANIACGFHAGDCQMISKTIDICKEYKVEVGAHPGYPDKENFGRTNMDVTPKQVYEFTLYQLGAIGAMANAKNEKLRFVKPHGAMYNMAGKNIDLAKAIVDAIIDYDSNLILLALSGSNMIKAAKEKGLKFANEVFADRAYEDDGSLRARKLDGSMITDEKIAIDRVVKMIKQGKVTTYSGNEIDIKADSVCVHGDGEKALEFVKRLNQAFQENDIKTMPIYEVIK